MSLQTRCALTRRVAAAGWGAYSIRALPDLCLGPAGLFRQSRCIGLLFMTRLSLSALCQTR
jgi:hypothetical protein